MSDTYEKDEMNTFNSMLNMMICSSDNKDDQHTEKCLISDEPLEDNHVTLACEHKFNYLHIFNEIKNQKCKRNRFEIQKLKPRELKCPYCRKIQSKLLPAREGFPQIDGVNVPDKSTLKGCCVYPLTRGKRKGEWCGATSYGCDYCKRHLKCIENKKIKTTPNNVKTTPNNVKIKKKNDHVDKEKYTPNTSILCQAIYKSGKRKGQPCTYLKKHGNYCGLHRNKNILTE